MTLISGTMRKRVSDNKARFMPTRIWVSLFLCSVFWGVLGEFSREQGVAMRKCSPSWGMLLSLCTILAQTRRQKGGGGMRDTHFNY